MLPPAVASEIVHSGPGPAWKSGPLIKLFETGKPRKPSKIVSQVRHKILIDNFLQHYFATSSIFLQKNSLSIISRGDLSVPVIILTVHIMDPSYSLGHFMLVSLQSALENSPPYANAKKHRDLGLNLL